MSINRESLSPVLFFPPVKTFPCPHYLPRRWATSHKADSMNTATDCPGRPVDKPYFKDHCSLSIFFLILNNPTPTNNCHVKFTADLLPIFPLLIHENPVPSSCNRYSIPKLWLNWLSRIPFSFRIPYPCPNFSDSCFPGPVSTQIPYPVVVS